MFHPAARVARFAHAVHQLPAAVEDRTSPERRDVALLVYRDAQHALRYLELSPLVATLLPALLDGAPLDGALATAAAAHDMPVNDALLADVARLLTDLGERGVLLGGVPPTTAAHGSASAPASETSGGAASGTSGGPASSSRGAGGTSGT